MMLRDFSQNLSKFLTFSKFDEPFFNWVSVHARLNSHCELWSYKNKKKKKKIIRWDESCLERTQRRRLSIKGYLRQQPINSDNVSSEAQVINVAEKSDSVIKKLIFYIFKHPVIYQIYDVMSVSSAYSNISFTQQFIKSPNLASWSI